MLKICIPFLLVLLFSCNNQSSNNSTKDSLEKSDQDTTVLNSQPEVKRRVYSGCYLSVLQRDTIVANLRQNGDSISGKLIFDNYQKDGSSGEVRGIIDNGILKLFYSFSSEGMNSVMDIQFKAAGDSLVRGIGEMNTKGDTAYFTNPAAIQYSGSVLHRIPCQMIPIKFR